MRGSSDVRTGNGADGLEYYRQVRERAVDPGMEGPALEGLVGTGHALRILGDADGAAGAYRSVLAAEDEVPEELRTESIGYLGMVLIAAGQIDEGEALLDEALARTDSSLPTFDRARWLIEKGELLRRRGEQEKGESCIDEVLQMNLLRYDPALRNRAEQIAQELSTVGTTPDAGITYQVSGDR